MRLLAGVAVLGLAAVLLLLRKPPGSTAPSGGPTAAPLESIAIPAPDASRDNQLRPELRQALGLVTGVAPQQRLDLIREIAGTLSESECDAVLHALLAPRAATEPEGWHAEYFHSLALVMREQAAARGRFARVLSTVAADSGRDAVLRDYSLQHLRQVWDRAAGDEALRGSIQATFRGLVEHDASLAASALLSLHLLGTPEGSVATTASAPQMSAGAPLTNSFLVANAELQPLVTGILSAPPTAANLPSRLVALRLVTERRLASEKEAVHRLAGDVASEHALVRMAAISCLASFRDPADRAFLESLDRSDPRIATAVERALR